MSENPFSIISSPYSQKIAISELGLTQQLLFGDEFSAIPQQQNASTNVGQRLAPQSLADQYELGLLTIPKAGWAGSPPFLFQV